MINYNLYLDQVDDSHQMTTHKDHIRKICDVVQNSKMNILELGSHAGISTAALALAAPESKITSVDLSDTIPEQNRVKYWESLGIANITPVSCDAGWFLRSLKSNEKYNLIFHDAMHGPGVMPEYLMCAEKSDILAIHDFEQLRENQQEELANLFQEYIIDQDIKNRVLFIGFKK